MRLQLAWDAVYGQVLIHQVEEAGLNLLEHVVTQLADEAVVVGAAHVDHELLVASLCALRESHHLLQSD